MLDQISGSRLSSPDGDEPRSGLRSLLEASIDTQLEHFRRVTLPPTCPAPDLALARWLIRVGEEDLLWKVARAEQETLREAWSALVDDTDLAASDRRELLACGSRFFSFYAELVDANALQVFRHAVENRGTCEGEAARFRALRAVLTEDDPGVPSIEGVDLDRHHLGLIAWGEDPVTIVRELAGRLERPLFIARPPDEGGVCWAWFSGIRPIDAAAERELWSFRSAGGRLAVGLESFGRRGFRATHRQACRARRFAGDSAAPVVRYADVAVEALAAENEAEARRFVECELGAIGDDSPASTRIRETLIAYFAAEHNAASAAASLGVHQQTVANRLRTAEERLGQASIGARRVELEVALRLRACLGDDGGPPAASRALSG